MPMGSQWFHGSNGITDNLLLGEQLPQGNSTFLLLLWAQIVVYKYPQLGVEIEISAGQGFGYPAFGLASFEQGPWLEVSRDIPPSYPVTCVLQQELFQTLMFMKTNLHSTTAEDSTGHVLSRVACHHLECCSCLLQINGTCTSHGLLFSHSFEYLHFD